MRVVLRRIIKMIKTNALNNYDSNMIDKTIFIIYDL